MGTWGVGILDSDEACDYRDDYLMHRSDQNLDPAAARAAVKANYDYDVSERVVYWLALAAIQLERGELEEEVRVQALQAIEAGGDLEEWRQTAFRPEDIAKRQAVLNQLAAELRGAY